MTVCASYYAHKVPRANQPLTLSALMVLLYRYFVVQSLLRLYEHSLLNTGTQTVEILLRHVSTICTLHLLDPSGVVLDCTGTHPRLLTQEA